MPRPNSVTNEDITRWSDNIDNDPYFKSGQVKNISVNDSDFREVLYAGLWMTEHLLDFGCPEEYIARLQFTAGQLSRNHDPWEVHQKMLDSYLSFNLTLESSSIN